MSMQNAYSYFSVTDVPVFFLESKSIQFPMFDVLILASIRMVSIAIQLCVCLPLNHSNCELLLNSEHSDLVVIGNDISGIETRCINLLGLFLDFYYTLDWMGCYSYPLSHECRVTS